MDARITKSRLANLLSYDWLKILVAIVFAVAGLVVFFTTVKTRPGKYHIFAVYGYREIVSGDEYTAMSDSLLQKGVFSYDVLKTEVETFGTDRYAEAAFAARRSTELGNVMFTTTNVYTETDDSGEQYETTVLQSLAGGESTGIALDVEQYFRDCEQYLIRFFGENWQEGALNEAEAEACFTARNGKDKRFRSEEKRLAGIEEEAGRLRKLRDDYLAVQKKFSDGTLAYSYVTDGAGEPSAAGIALGKLAGLSRIYYYTVDEDGVSVRETENICLVLLRNDGDAGKPAYAVENDLRYEAVSFLRYLADVYGG